MQTVVLPSGERVPAFGLGTWQIGDRAALRAEELATIRLALDLGVKLIDTAEMYGEGRSETLIGEAIRGRRDEVFLVTKIYPHNASRQGSVAACERSLRRLGTERIDLYLLHWRGDIALAETIEAFVTLQSAGKIRHYGVSNLDVADMQELWGVTGGPAVATDQLLYNLTRRGIERELLPWLRAHRIPIMAYSPIERSELLRDKKLVQFAQRHALTPVQAALGWLLRNDDIIVIPKTGSRERLRENLSALEHVLTPAQAAEIEKLFPAPKRAQTLEML